jgi:hypothetical protein
LVLTGNGYVKELQSHLESFPDIPGPPGQEEEEHTLEYRHEGDEMATA